MLQEKLRKLRNKKGFTLVELIVVVAIIAVLAAILVPLMGNYLHDSKVSSALAGAKSIKTIATTAMTSAVSKDAGRKSVDEVATILVSIVNGVPSVTVTDDTDNWMGRTGTDSSANMAAFEAALESQLVNIGDGSAVVGVHRNMVVSCVFVGGSNVDPEHLEPLIITATGGAANSSGFIDVTQFDSKSIVKSGKAIDSAVGAIAGWA